MHRMRAYTIGSSFWFIRRDSPVESFTKLFESHRKERERTRVYRDVSVVS